jgi:aspartate/methionine/tyrosine aminotransferase
VTLAPDRAIAPASSGGTGTGTLTDENYPMRRWFFDDAAGRYDIDLGDSHVQVGTLGELGILPPDLELGYGTDRGGTELVRRVAERYGTPELTDRIVITHGAQEALYLLYCTLLRPGDRVIALRPGWQQAWEAPARLGCETVTVRFAPDFSLDLNALAAADGPGLRLITLNSPSNPTGRRLRPGELEAVIALADARGARILLDEEYLVDLTESPAVRDGRLVSVSSLSKVAGLPGLRVGWLYAEPDLAVRCAEYKHFTSIANSVLCERLATDVLADWPRYVDRSRRLMTDGLRILEEFAARHTNWVRLVPPEGTPFAWLDLLTGESSLAFARRVLDAGVLVMPGETLGVAGGFRVCIAREPELLRAGLDRIASVIAATPRPGKDTDPR